MGAGGEGINPASTQKLRLHLRYPASFPMLRGEKGVGFLVMSEGFSIGIEVHVAAETRADVAQVVARVSAFLTVLATNFRRG